MKPVEPCAFVLPEHLAQSNDVLSMTGLDPLQSPGLFGLSVYSIFGGTEKQLEMFYVSKAAAYDRSPESNPMNGEGVKPGWYVIAEPGMTYTVTAQFLSKSSNFHPEYETHFRISLSVDGRPALKSYAMDSGEAQFKGFCVRRSSKSEFPNPSEQFSAELEYESFTFANISTEGTIATRQNDKLGTIQLHVESGVVSDRPYEDLLKKHLFSEKPPPSKPDPRGPEADGAHEAAVAKKGISLETKGGEKNVESVKLIRFSHYGDLSKAEITLHVRQKSWLQSRKILDLDGNACKASLLKELIRAHFAPRLEGHVKSEPGSVINIEEDEVMFVPVSDVIDLT